MLKEMGKKASEAAVRKPDAGRNGKKKTNEKPAVKTEIRQKNKPATKTEIKQKIKPATKTEIKQKNKPVKKAEVKQQSKPAVKAEIRSKNKPVNNKIEPKQEKPKQQEIKVLPEKKQQPKALLKPVPGETVKIIPLGGLEQIGLNITAFEYKESIIVVDCGLAFPTEDMPGVDLVIPDVSYLTENANKVKAFFVTHGHEDHIGAFPYVLRELNVPVYGNKLTLALIEHKLREAGIFESAKLRTVKYGDTIKAGDFKIEFVKTNHSIPDASALVISSPAGIIFHTGDFKVDYTPIFGDPIDLQRMAEIGNMGCLALMCDSTNAQNAGSTASEKTVGRKIELIFSEHKDQRFVVASFASNVDRVQQIINAAHKFGRKVIVEGKSMSNILDIATRLGYIRIPENTLVDIEMLKNYKPEDTVIITTGSQGESMAALSRMAAGTHKKVTINENDVIVMSSKTIPGNEKAVAKVINELYMKGAEVVFHDTHVSGHACEEDIKLIYALLRPKYSVPVHGEYMHRVAQKQIAIDMGMPGRNVKLISSGDVLEIGENRCEVTDHIETGAVFVEGSRVGDIGDVVIRDRQYLAQNGIIIVSVAMAEGTGEIAGGPEIVTRGFIYEKENGDLIEELKGAVEDRLISKVYRTGADEIKVRNEIKDALKNYLLKKYKKAPVIIPVVTLVNL